MKGLFAIIGLILVQGSTLFQLVKFLHKKETKGVSVAFWWSVFIGLIFYLVYSIQISDKFYIASNLIGLVLSGISISLYYYYRHQNEKRWRKERKNDRKNHRSDPYGWLAEDSFDAAKELGISVYPRKESYH
jgi:uncharacterized protein with PQ loop repeat